jgi:hypothetical protein
MNDKDIREAIRLINEVFAMLDILAARRTATDEFQQAAKRFAEIRAQLAALANAPSTPTV